MAVIATNGNTTLSTVNGFVNVPSHNLACGNSANVSQISLATHRAQLVNFDTACNITGVSIILEHAMSTTSAFTRSVSLYLEEYQTVDSFNTTTERINKVAHGLLDGDRVSFFSTGVLPTGITANGSYFVINKTADDFQISTTLGGSVVALSGTPTGSASVGKTIAFKTKTADEIELLSKRQPTNSATAYQYYNNGGCFMSHFEFTTPAPVDTTIGKYRLRFTHATGTGTWYIRTSSLTAVADAYCYACVGDVQVTATDLDVLVIKDQCIVDKSFIIGGVFGVGDTATGVGGWILPNPNPTSVEDICLLKWEENPTSSYTLELRGTIVSSDWAGFRIGTETNPNPKSAKADVYFGTAVVGTTSPAFRPIGWGSVTYSYSGAVNYFFYGEKGTSVKTTLSANALVGATKIYTTDVMPWTAGDYIVIGKQNTRGQGEQTKYVISSISGNEITLTTPIATYDRIVGGSVFRVYNNHGISFRKDGTVTAAIYGLQLMNLVASGIDLSNVYFFSVSNVTYYFYMNTAKAVFKLPHLVEDVTSVMTGTSVGYVHSPNIPPLGLTFRRVYGINCSPLAGAVVYYNASYKSGYFTMEDCAFTAIYRSNASSATNIKMDIKNVTFENSPSGYTPLTFLGTNTTFDNVKYWCIGGTTVGPNFGSSTNSIIKNCVFANCAYGVITNPNVVILKCKASNNTFYDDIYTNTTDLIVNLGSYLDIEFKDCLGITTIDKTLLSECTEGSMIRFVNDGQITNKDFVLTVAGTLTRCGYGLADTTVHTAGDNAYSLRLDAGDFRLYWESDIPTGDITNKPMAVGVWVKINSANYCAGTCVLPRLEVTYDGGTLAYASAAQSTEWQLLIVPFMPLTSTGKIKVTFATETDATGSDAYVYFDDFSCFYPAGHQLNLGNMDNFDGALPVSPMISTGVNATDIWATPISLVTGAGTTGKKLKDGLTTNTFIALK